MLRFLYICRFIGFFGGLILLHGGFGLRAQVPLSVDAVAVFGADDVIDIDWQIAAAERAQAAGLVNLAETIYAGLLRKPGISGEIPLDRIRLGLAQALLGQGRFPAAKAVLDQVGDGLNERADFLLYRAVAVYGEGGPGTDFEAFRGLLRSIDPADLAGDARAWYEFLRGLRAEADGDYAAAREAFRGAAGLAGAEALRLHFESLALRQEILAGPADADLLPELTTRLNSLEGDRAAYPYVRELAVLLARLGRGGEAVGTIDRELANTAAGYEARQREQLRLLKGLILGAESVTGRATLKELIRSGRDRNVVGIALQMLVRVQGEDADLFEFLNVLISQTEPHPLLGQLYYLRSQLALKSANDPELVALAERDARTLLEQFPGLSSVSNVYRLLAYIALTREAPQYRTAADFLIRLRDAAPEREDLVELNQMIGDCYFLNGDYVSAVDFYSAARNRQLSTETDGAIFLRLVTAQIRSGRVEAAIDLIDGLDFGGRIRLEDRWRAEWNISQALLANGAVERALRRVRLLLESSETGQMATLLDIRLRWLEAHLSLEAGDFEGLAGRIDRLLARLEALPEAELGAAETQLLITEVLLLRGDQLLRSGEPESGLAAFRSLRERFVASAAAQRSYLIEAGHYGDNGDFLAAQNALVSLFERDPGSPLAPQALFEAALYCERRGTEQFGEAIVLHNRLAETYPQDPLYYHSRLKQGNLLRSMNDFTGAQIVYENLINRYPSHALRYLAELSRADCLLALAGNDPSQLLGAINQLERLLDLPNLPLDFQVEASFKWAFALEKSGQSGEAKEVLSLAVSRFLLDSSQAEALGGGGRYWIARSMLRLGALLEAEASRAEARRIYRSIIAYNLPGRHIARAQLDQLMNLD